MADGSTMKMQSAREISRLFGQMFNPPINLLSWEVFRDAFGERDGKAYKPAEAKAAHHEFVQNPSTCPEHVREFCNKMLKKGKNNPH